MARSKKLRTYEERRDFRGTPEPRTGGARGARREKSRRFVIQEHAATSHHYDFRLEVGGVLKSWAVPKGPSTDPRVKRLAVPTEDHPLSYAGFEGVIPEGHYGAGPVSIWDRGTYENLRRDGGRVVGMERCLRDGRLEVRLSGKKIRGGYALVRTARGPHGRWLLVKMRDDESDARRNPTSTEPESVASGRSIDEIREQGDGDEGA